ncbi:MAG: hypothetical protein Q9214_004452 [Letrouitia sp. 1 TL-2023]
MEGFFEWIMDPLHPRGRNSRRLPVPGDPNYEGSLEVRRVGRSSADPRATKYYPETDSFHVPRANGGPYDIPAREAMKDYGNGAFWGYRREKLNELRITGRVRGRPTDRWGECWPTDQEEMLHEEEMMLEEAMLQEEEMMLEEEMLYREEMEYIASLKSQGRPPPSRGPRGKSRKHRGPKSVSVNSYHGGGTGTPPDDVEEQDGPYLALPGPPSHHSDDANSYHGSRAASPAAYSVEEPGSRHSGSRSGSRRTGSRSGRNSRRSRRSSGRRGHTRYGDLDDISE